MFFVLSSFYLSAQVQPALIDTTYRLPLKEKLDYRIYYKFSGLWAYAADATFSIDTLTIENKKAYKLSADAFTRKKYRWIYNLEDHYISFTDIETFLPLRFEEHNIEKGVHYDYTYIFDWENKKVRMTLKESKKEDRILEKELPDFITDSYSGVHFIRLWDYSRYAPGDTIEFETMLDGKIYKQQIVYHGKEKIKNREGDDVDVFALEALIKNSSFISKKDGVRVWVTDNKDRWIVKVDVNIIIGRVIVFMNTPGVASFDTHSND